MCWGREWEGCECVGRGIRDGEGQVMWSILRISRGCKSEMEYLFGAHSYRHGMSHPGRFGALSEILYLPFISP